VHLSPASARDLADIQFSAQDQSRMIELLDKGNRGCRTPEEEVEAREFERLGHVISIIKSIARRTLRQN
jgi:hypothetical protein